MTDEERIAKFEPARAAVRPPACHEGINCWVKNGPGAILVSRTGCLSCKDQPNLVGNEYAHARVLARIISGDA
jgi:hypothetical protein